MQNGPTKSSRIKLNDLRAIAAYHGWHDALGGRGLNPVWSDHSSRILAITYINWRLRATEIQRSGRVVPNWNTTRIVSGLYNVRRNNDPGRTQR